MYKKRRIGMQDIVKEMNPKTEDEIIREVAEEEGMTEEEVKEMWEAFKQQAEEYKQQKIRAKNATKPKRDNKKAKAKRKNAKKSRKKNR